MRKLIRHLIWFLIPLLIIVVSGLFLPATPSASKSLLFANIQKDSLLQNVKSPRIILVGGSNVSFSFNSQMIKDSLNLNPINTGITDNLDLRYIIENTIQYIKEGDVVILVPTYQYFYMGYSFGTKELLATVFDVNLSKIRLLNVSQILNIIRFIPKYSLSKFRPTRYIKTKENVIYGVNSFNKYGDVYTHLGMEKEEFPSYTIRGKFNHKIIKKIKEFEARVEKKNAFLYVTYPALQEMSYLNSIEQIQKVESEYIKNELKILGNAKKYVVPESMLFNAPVHLNKNGMDYYTNLLIEDFKKARTHNK